jgi:ribose 5-phosphate isomerase RpiB
MKKKEKIKEILKNLNKTLDNLGDNDPVESQSTAYVSSRVTRRILNKKIEELQEKYKEQ